MQKRLFFLVSMLLTFSLTVMAQITTSSMAGKVTFDSQAGEEVIGATVVAVHTPSGTRYTAVTNASGRFSIQGMRTGGPYEVTISYVGYQPKVVKGVILQLGETYNLAASITENANELGEIVISGKASKLTTEQMGASTNINNAQIVNMPTVSRSITDVTRLSPYGGNGMQIAGSDSRSANFTVDGANFNNNFGLNGNLPGGNKPISLDAIEELQVVVSPYDVRQTNFIGGGVNAITKSGTNTFKGTAYIYHQNENMRGDAVDGEQIAGARERDRNTTYGFTFGGPIIKDKLFFFANVDYTKTPTVATRWRASENGVADPDNYVSRTTVADLQRVSDFVKEKYGYNTGSYSDFPADQSNTKLLARLDWNITNDHHLALRYNYTLNRSWSAPNRSSMDGGTASAYDRMSQYSMSFANSMYSQDNIVHSLSFDLNSRFSDNLSNQFLATFSKLDDGRGSPSDEFPFIDIQDGTGTNAQYMSLGYELFTWMNGVHNTVFNVKDDVTYYMGDHKIMGGLSYEYQMADNNYMRNGTGYYRYASIDDFINGAAPEVVCLTYGYGGETEPASRVRFNKLGLYAQDEWNITDDLKLTAGIRFDGFFFNNADLMTNQAVYDLDYNGRHIDTGKWPGTKVTVSPRVGFTYDVFGDNSLKVRGGTGLFTGRLPLVFFTNMPTNSLMIQNNVQLNGTGVRGTKVDMTQFAGGLVTDANGKATINALRDKLVSMGFPADITPDKGTIGSYICGVDPDFKMPQVWKTSIAVDYSFPTSFPFSITAEGIFNKTINAATISDWSLKPVGGFARFNGVDNRPIFPTDSRYQPTRAFVLENTSRGYGWTANVTVNMRPIESLSLMAAYTHTVSKEVTGLPGNNAESAYTYLPAVQGPNNIRLHNSQYVTPDRFIVSATHNDKHGNHLSLIYEAWRGGSNYSYMTTNDMNGDGYSYDAIYIPTDQQVANREFRFVSDDDRDRFMDYVHNNDYLKNHQGEYAEPYSLYSPWVHRVDLSYKHDFTVNFGKTTHKLQLNCDIKNFLNMFNSTWGVSKFLNPEIGSDPRILKYEGVDQDGYATFSTPQSINGNTETFTYSHTIGQCWSASVGIKYIFN